MSVVLKLFYSEPMNKHVSHSHLKLYVKISSVDTRLDDIGASNGHKKIAVKRTEQPVQCVNIEVSGYYISHTF